MISILRYVYIDKSIDIVNKYNNAYHRTIKMKPADVKSSTFIDFEGESDSKYTKFKVVKHLIVSKYNKHFAKDDTPDLYEEVFVI